MDELAWESISTRSVFFPRRASPAANDIAVEVFPTPPFWEAIEITIFCVNQSENLEGGFFDLISLHLNVE